MFRDKIYVLTFFLRVPGDLSIPDVHWSGDLPEARTWALKRLEYLGAADRPADQLRPLVCEIRTEDFIADEQLTPEAAPITYNVEPTHGVSPRPL